MFILDSVPQPLCDPRLILSREIRHAENSNRDVVSSVVDENSLNNNKPNTQRESSKRPVQKQREPISAVHVKKSTQRESIITVVEKTNTQRKTIVKPVENTTTQRGSITTVVEKKKTSKEPEKASPKSSTSKISRPELHSNESTEKGAIVKNKAEEAPSKSSDNVDKRSSEQIKEVKQISTEVIALQNGKS